MPAKNYKRTERFKVNQWLRYKMEIYNNYKSKYLRNI